MTEKTFWSTYVHDYGWSIIPIQCRSKKPVIGSWRQFQDRKPTDQEVSTWESKYPHNNVAVICGAVSNLVVLDIDSEDGYKWIRENGYKIPKTPRTESSPGKGHFYFRHPGFTVKNMIRKVPGIDIKGDGGYVVAPPSTHPSGARYRWLNNFEPDKVEVAPCPDWLLELIDPDKQPQETKTAPKKAKASGDVALEDSDIDDSDWVTPLLHNGAAKGSRNTLATKLAGYFIGLGQSKERVLGILIGWNHLNDPPLSVKELQTSVNSVAKTDELNKLRENPHIKAGAESTCSTEERRQALLGGAADRLDLPIRRMQKINGEVPQYVMLIENTEVTMTASVLMNQHLFKTKVVEAANKIPRSIKKTEWEGMVQNLLDVAEIIEAGEESTILGDLKGQLIEYISRTNVFDIDSEERPMPEFDIPFTWQGKLYLNRDAFLKWLSTYLMTKPMERKASTQYFTRLGLEYVRQWVNAPGVVKRQFRAWIVPKDIYEAGLEQKKGGEADEKVLDAA